MGMKAPVTDSPDGGPIDWKAAKEEILAGLNVESEYQNLGVKFSRSASSSKGWRECHALGREDADPSAAVNTRTGVYKDSGGAGEVLGFFDFAMRHGGHGRWIDCMRHYADRAGVTLGTAKAGGKGKVREAEYPYRDADGTVRYCVFRYRTPAGKKTFSQHPPDGQGGWKYGSGCMDGITPLPYRLPEMLAAPGHVVHVVEGERDADRLADLGLIATTNHQGANSTDETWPKFLHHFRGRSVVILPDNDKGGIQHARKVAAYLRPVAASVKLLMLPGLPAKGDASDWIDSGGDVERLAELAEAAPEFDPAAPAVEPTAAEVEEDSITTICLADVVPEQVEWLLPDRVPLGKITLLAGEPGLGKSYLTMDLIARVTTDGLIPGGGGLRIKGGSVVLLSAEDGLADTIRPRLDAAGADVTKVHALTTVRTGPGKYAHFDLTYMEALETAINRFPNTKLVVIDPVTSYIGAGTDDHKNSSLRTLLGPLADLANRTHVAVIIVTHLNKTAGTKALNRITGSIAYAALARAAWLLIRDPEDHPRRLLLSIKNNLAPDPTGLGYRIIDGVIQWEDAPVSMTANDALADEANEVRGSKGKEKENASKVEQAEAWLSDILSCGKEIPSDEIMAQGEGKGFKRDVLFAAKKRLGVKARKGGFHGGWAWFLPPDASTDQSDASHSSHASDASDPWDDGPDF